MDHRHQQHQPEEDEEELKNESLITQQEQIKIQWDTERRRILSYEAEHCKGNPLPYVWLRRPPIPLVNDIVVFVDPTVNFSLKLQPWTIKRVIGVGGQMARNWNGIVKD